MPGNIIQIDESEISSLLEGNDSLKNLHNFAFAELNEFHFASLWPILLDEPYSEEYESKIQVRTSKDGETYIVLIPYELTELIASKESHENSNIVKQWALTEEFQWGWSERDVSNLFSSLISLSNKALKNGQSLVYWCAL